MNMHIKLHDRWLQDVVDEAHRRVNNPRFSGDFWENLRGAGFEVAVAHDVGVTKAADQLVANWATGIVTANYDFEANGFNYDTKCAGPGNFTPHFILSAPPVSGVIYVLGQVIAESVDDFKQRPWFEAVAWAKTPGNDHGLYLPIPDRWTFFTQQSYATVPCGE